MTSKAASDIVTIVIPVRNRAGIVGEALSSVSAQTALPAVVLVDNGSTDDTRRVLDRWAAGYSAPVRVLTEMKSGAPAARNCGLRHVVTPYVMFFDSDDIMSPHHVERFVSAVENRPEIDIVGWDIGIVNLDGSHTTGAFSDSDVWFRHIFNAILSTQRYGVRTDLVRKVGGWDECLPVWNDYELGFRLLAQSPAMMKIENPGGVLMRRQSESITGISYSSKVGCWEASLRKCHKDLMDAGLSGFERWLRLRWAVLAAIYAREGSDSYLLALDVAVEDATRWQCLLLNAAYSYTRWGFRGIHYLLRGLL